MGMFRLDLQEIIYWLWIGKAKIFKNLCKNERDAKKSPHLLIATALKCRSFHILRAYHHRILSIYNLLHYPFSMNPFLPPTVVLCWCGSENGIRKLIKILYRLFMKIQLPVQVEFFVLILYRPHVFIVTYSACSSLNQHRYPPERTIFTPVRRLFSQFLRKLIQMCVYSRFPLSHISCIF